jgi:hypothetical protein
LLADLLVGDCVRVTSANDLKKRRIRLFIVAVSDDGRLKLVDELVDHELAGRIPHDEESGLGPFDSRSDYTELPR